MVANRQALVRELPEIVVFRRRRDPRRTERSPEKGERAVNRTARCRTAPAASCMTRGGRRERSKGIVVAKCFLGPKAERTEKVLRALHQAAGTTGRPRRRPHRAFKVAWSKMQTRSLGGRDQVHVDALVRGQPYAGRARTSVSGGLLPLRGDAWKADVAPNPAIPPFKVSGGSRGPCGKKPLIVQITTFTLFLLYD